MQAKPTMCKQCVNPNPHIDTTYAATFILLGVYFSSDLSRSVHISFSLKKCAKRFYVVYQLVRAGIDMRDIVSVYCSLIRSILEYACPV